MLRYRFFIILSFFLIYLLIVSVGFIYLYKGSFISPLDFHIKQLKDIELLYPVLPEHHGPLLPLEDLMIWPLVNGTRGSESVYLSPNFEFINYIDNGRDINGNLSLDGPIDFYKKFLITRRNPLLGWHIPEDHVLESIYIIKHHNYDNGPIPTPLNEKYILYVTRNIAILSVFGRFGAIRGLSTFVQLLTFNPMSISIEDKLPLYIEDGPKFEYRGFLLDTARNYFSVESILNLIPFLSMTKMNVLHWHFVDDQSYSFESKVYPKITLSTYPDKHKFYTLNEVKQVVAEGTKWGVRIIPEIDLPSHTGGWRNLGDILTECPRFACSKAWGMSLNPFKERTYEVIENLLKEIMEIFPDPVLHLGGDEVDFDCWKEDPSVSENVLIANQWEYFERKLEPIIKKTHKKVIRWEESMYFYQTRMLESDNVTFQIWFSPERGDSLLRSGHKLISSLGWYLDWMCNSWVECYQRNPLENIIKFVTPSNIHLLENIQGLETCAWELNQTNFDMYNVWMRTIGVSEHMWSSSPTRWLTEQPLTTKSRIIRFCNLLSSMGFFPQAMCTERENYPKIPVPYDPYYLWRKAQRDQMICHRNNDGDINLPCTTLNCINLRMS